MHVPFTHGVVISHTLLVTSPSCMFSNDRGVDSGTAVENDNFNVLSLTSCIVPENEPPSGGVVSRRLLNKKIFFKKPMHNNAWKFITKKYNT